ncbi:MAG TPA: hypothetical protein VH370_00835 [Humisphaera sp.]|jgi:hypothetical protein|nr:hypothetical protein [Humisphaera sp.]
MVPLSVVDMVFCSDQPLERTIEVASQFIAAALTDLDGISKLDMTLMPVGRQVERQHASLLHGMYGDWAVQAESLLERIERLERRIGKKLPRADELRDAHGRTRAMLSISVEDMEQARKDILEGRTIPAAEVRRAIRMGTL